MTIRLTIQHEEPSTFKVVTQVTGPTSVELTEDETRETVKALVLAHQMAGGEQPDSRKQHTIERILLRLGMELESLDALHRY